MDDLIERTDKLTRGAGAIQTGQYDAAHSCQRTGRCLNVSSVVLGAVVGASIFSDLVTDYALATGLIAVLAAALTAVQATSSYGDRAGKHRIAGAEYGDVRRRTDLLKIKMVAGDIDREEALAEVEALGAHMTKLAKSSDSLPDRIYFNAKAKFRRDHPGYWANEASS